MKPVTLAVVLSLGIITSGCTKTSENEPAAAAKDETSAPAFVSVAGQWDLTNVQTTVSTQDAAGKTLNSASQNSVYYGVTETPFSGMSLSFESDATVAVIDRSKVVTADASKDRAAVSGVSSRLGYAQDGATVTLKVLQLGIKNTQDVVCLTPDQTASATPEQKAATPPCPTPSVQYGASTYTVSSVQYTGTALIVSLAEAGSTTSSYRLLFERLSSVKAAIKVKLEEAKAKNDTKAQTELEKSLSYYESFEVPVTEAPAEQPAPQPQPQPDVQQNLDQSQTPGSGTTPSVGGTEGEVAPPSATAEEGATEEAATGGTDGSPATGTDDLIDSPQGKPVPDAVGDFERWTNARSSPSTFAF